MRFCAIDAWSTLCVLNLVNTKNTWDPALIISTRLVNLSWCFLAATRPIMSSSVILTVSFHFQNYLARWEFWNIQTCPLQDHPWPDRVHGKSWSYQVIKIFIPQQTQVSAWRVNSQTQDSEKYSVELSVECISVDHLWWAGQDESVVNVNQVASIIQQDVTIVTIFHLKLFHEIKF